MEPRPSPRAALAAGCPAFNSVLVFGAGFLFAVLLLSSLGPSAHSWLSSSGRSALEFEGPEQASALLLNAGVSGSLWAATVTRRWEGARVYAGLRDRSAPPAATEAAAAAWFTPPTRRAARLLPGGAGCESDSWVVITSIFSPSRLMSQLEQQPEFCTVVVADRKTPVAAWAAVTASGRVRLLTVEAQLALGYRITPLLAFNHFSRKNIGYIYAVRAGAKVVYDTDDDNILKDAPDGGVSPIPVLDARSTGHRVRQARHCNHSDATTRSWNPYPAFGPAALASWPRGLPLDDITWTTAPPCVGTGEGGSAYTLDAAEVRLPGVSFAVQQSLADVHPDIDAIHRLTRAPLTFSFAAPAAEASTTFSGLLGAGGATFAPYNAQATLHTEAALWGMLLPVSVHGRVSDILRSYIAQTLMRQYGLAVVFTRPIVNQERSPHNFLKDFQSELPLYLRASGLVDFLRRWEPSQPHLTLPAQYEELLIELYERGVVEELDVKLAQAWLRDLDDAGYAFPTRASHGLAAAWRDAEHKRAL